MARGLFVGLLPLQVNLIFSIIVIFHSELNSSLQEGSITKKCSETISKITGLIHKSLITYNLYKMH